MWNEFLKKNKGKGYTMKQLSDMYKKQKSITTNIEPILISKDKTSKTLITKSNQHGIEPMLVPIKNF